MHLCVRRPPDHPRVCGEHHGTTAAKSRAGGSSPRMRGALDALPDRGLCWWIIPAYAGSTCPGWPRAWLRTDHPRVCGEHVIAGTGSVSGAGSSPRMRGAHRFHYPMRRVHRIIPAYAGSTLCGSLGRRRTSLLLAGDHPRVCGEHVNNGRQNGREWGSSPRMRGAPVWITPGVIRSGIIPAYAGSTRCSGFRRRSDRDHPRVCGEHGKGKVNRRSKDGSSPRMRGALACDVTVMVRTEIIPAYAGSTVGKRKDTDHG